MQPAGNPAPFEQLAEPAAEAERLVSAYTGLVAAQPVPAAEPVDRSGWIDANLSSLETVLEPTAAAARAASAGPLGLVAGGVLAIEAGAVSGFLAGRVLGQYEFPVLEPDKPARLLFVAPNLAHAAEPLEAPDDQLLRWVALHEMTHALQFGGVPVAARAPGGDAARAARRARARPARPAACARCHRPAQAVRPRARGRAGDGRRRRRAARDARPRAGVHGRARGLRRARDGRRRRHRARRPARRCAAPCSAAGATARAC